MARDACPGPEFLSMRRNGVPALASQRARTSPVGPAPTIKTCGWLTAFVPRCAERNRSVIVGELAGGVKGVGQGRIVGRDGSGRMAPVKMSGGTRDGSRDSSGGG